VTADDLTLADSIVGGALFFFGDYEEIERGELPLEKVQGRIDMLGVSTQALDLARSNPDNWSEYLHVGTSSYEHLWPAQRLELLLLSNYAALHVTLRRGLPLFLISPESIAREVLSLEWIPREATNEELLEIFLAHPASQAPKAE
jgi:hypothetical protein